MPLPCESPDGPQCLQVSVLLRHHEHMAQQIAELTVMASEVEKRALRYDNRLSEIGTELAANTVITTEVRALLETFKGGMKFLGWMGVAAKWVAGVAAAIGAVIAIWESVRYGKLPKP